jgi:putative phosphoserine phosphatase/1-acylglycerol-3-phosphate O-acyltransferase
MRSFPHLTHEIERSPTGPEIAAFFDLDGTLIAGFSVVALLRDRLLHGALSARDVAYSARAAIDFYRGHAAFTTLLGGMARVLRGTERAELERVAQELFDQELAGSIYPEARHILEAHRRRGHTLVIASAATDLQVEPIARDLGIAHVLASQLELERGRFTGRVQEPVGWGTGKAEAAHEFARRTGVKLDRSYFYTDGGEDLPLLEAVGHPRATNPDRQLTRVARGRGWPVLRFESRRRPEVADALRTLLLISGIPTMLFSMLPASFLLRDRRPLLNLVSRAWGELGSLVAGVQLEVEGAEHLDAERPALFVFNHQSPIDLMLVARLVQRDYGVLVHGAEPRLSLFRRLAERADSVFLDSGKDDFEGRQRAVRALREGTSLVVAPEIGVGPRPRLGPFASAPFELAVEAGVPIVPIVLANACDALPPNGLFVRRARVDVRVHPPVSTRLWRRRASLDEAIAGVRELFVQGLREAPVDFDGAC